MDVLLVKGSHSLRLGAGHYKTRLSPP
ncbi:hypothetical protein HID58_013264 [Brassica napus]|uniref:Uncharacterized protein n=1 Tax=Brassica napus TaxID=3708 RepID=A0ABQ8E3D5_BRANA|nr:hypothetical protein HID58_013264 [Brassica napus]